MTNPDQLPERLIAFRPKRSPTSLAGGPAFAAEEQRPGDRPTCAEEQAYVRDDVAAAALADETQDKNLKVGLLKGERAALRAEVEALREALRKVQVCCQYKGTQQILMVACDVKAIVDGALAAKGVG